MKTCTKCERELDVAEFSFKNKAKGIRTARCKKCVKEYWNGHYERNTERYKARAKAYDKKAIPEKRQKIWDYLLVHPCVTCGEADPIVLEFDHLDPTEKDGTISNNFRWWGWSRIEREIAKCQVLCANCHRRKTAVQFGHYATVVRCGSSMG